MSPTTLPDLIAERFAAWRATQHKALIPYITAGYPTRESTADILRAMVRAGADIIELGVPFSDPVADGPTIQRSSQVALEQGVDLAWVLEQLREFRHEDDTPVVIFSYLNPVLSYGWSRFIADAVAAGANGVLLTDLPLGGDAALESEIEQSPLSLIRLIAPTTSAERAAEIARNTQGFVYYIARMGVTGARAALPEDLPAQVNALRAVTEIPICVGFGVSNAQQAAAVGQLADGVIVGSALIDALDAGGPAAVEALLRSMHEAL